MAILGVGKNKADRRRLNAILEICKIRKDVNAIECFDDDCEKIVETKIVSGRSRRRGNGTLQKTETDTGNILVSCEAHGWRQLCSVAQLDGLRMPERTTKVNEGATILSDPESNVVER